MDPAEFRQRCKRHDWQYRFSEDRRAFRQGQEEEALIRAAAAADPELQAILDEFQSRR
jgi:hypothetical protein